MADGTLRRVRLKFEREYTQIPNEWLRDPQLSLRARGLLALLMSHRDGYTVTHKALVTQNPEGASAMQAAIDELKRHRYLTVNKVRGRGGRIEGWIWELTDPAEEKLKETPHLDLPDLDKPDLAEPHLDNQSLKEANPEEDLIPASQTGHSTRAGVNEDALSGAQQPVATETYAQLRTRLEHQPCPSRPSHGPHNYAPGYPCSWCGLRLGQYWNSRGDIAFLDDLQDPEAIVASQPEGVLV